MQGRCIRPPRQLVIAVREIWSTRSCRDWVYERKHDAPNRQENPFLKHPHLPTTAPAWKMSASVSLERSIASIGAIVEIAVARPESVRAQDSIRRFAIGDLVGNEHFYHSVNEAIEALAQARHGRNDLAPPKMCRSGNIP